MQCFIFLSTVIEIFLGLSWHLWFLRVWRTSFITFWLSESSLRSQTIIWWVCLYMLLVLIPLELLISFLHSICLVFSLLWNTWNFFFLVLCIWCCTCFLYLVRQLTLDWGNVFYDFSKSIFCIFDLVSSSSIPIIHSFDLFQMSRCLIYPRCPRWFVPWLFLFNIFFD